MILREADGKFTTYAWPGGYPVIHLCGDGGYLCPTCANDPSNPVHTDLVGDDQWQIVDSFVNWEDPDLFCDHCHKRLEAAYV